MTLAQATPAIPDISQFLTLPLTFGTGLVGLILIWRWVVDPYLTARHARRMQMLESETKARMKILEAEQEITKMQTTGIEGIKQLHMNVTTHLTTLERILADTRDTRCDDCPTKRT